MVTTVGFLLGATLAVSTAKVLKNQFTLITPSLALRITAFNIGAKVLLYAAYKIGQGAYETLTFPLFDSFEKKTPHELGLLLAHFKRDTQAWSNQSLKKQLGFNQMLIRHSLPPLSITTFSLNGDILTEEEIITFNTLLKDCPLDQKLATALYEAHCPPQGRAYKKDELPYINPKKASVSKLSDAQIQWHHKWLVAHNSASLSTYLQSNFATRFYQLDLPPPSKVFVAKLPLPKSSIGMTTNKASYFFNFYIKSPGDWKKLQPKEQAFLNRFFKMFNFGVIPPSDPFIYQIPSLPKDILVDFQVRYRSNNNHCWDLKGENFQKTFNEALIKHELSTILPTSSSMPAWQITALFAITTLLTAHSGIVPVSMPTISFKRDEDTECPTPSPIITPTCPSISPSPYFPECPTPSPIGPSHSSCSNTTMNKTRTNSTPHLETDSPHSPTIYFYDHHSLERLIPHDTSSHSNATVSQFENCTSKRTHTLATPDCFYTGFDGTTYTTPLPETALIKHPGFSDSPIEKFYDAHFFSCLTSPSYSSLRDHDATQARLENRTAKRTHTLTTPACFYTGFDGTAYTIPLPETALIKHPDFSDSPIEKFYDAHFFSYLFTSSYSSLRDHNATQARFENRTAKRTLTLTTPDCFYTDFNGTTHTSPPPSSSQSNFLTKITVVAGMILTSIGLYSRSTGLQADSLTDIRDMEPDEDGTPFNQEHKYQPKPTQILRETPNIKTAKVVPDPRSPSIPRDQPSPTLLSQAKQGNVGLAMVQQPSNLRAPLTPLSLNRAQSKRPSSFSDKAKTLWGKVKSRFPSKNHERRPVISPTREVVPAIVKSIENWKPETNSSLGSLHPGQESVRTKRTNFEQRKELQRSRSAPNSPKKYRTNSAMRRRASVFEAPPRVSRYNNMYDQPKAPLKTFR